VPEVPEPKPLEAGALDRWSPDRIAEVRPANRPAFRSHEHEPIRAGRESAKVLGNLEDD